MVRDAVGSADEWADVCSRTFVPLGVHSIGADFRGDLHHRPLCEDVGVTAVRSGGSEVFRSRRHIACDPRDGFLFAVHGTGTGTVEQGGRRVELSAGAATLYDTERPYTLRFPTSMSETVLHFPRRLLDPRGTRSAAITARPLLPGNPALDALRTLLSSALAQDAPAACNGGGTRDGRAAGAGPTVHAVGPALVPVSRAFAGVALADAALSLVQAAIAVEVGERPTTAAGGDRLALLMQVHTFIDEHLDDVDLTPQLVANAHCVSLRHLQAVLSAVGDTPAEMICTRRLRRACTLLQSGESVAGTARRVGFADPNTFTRAFKRHHGETPTDYRTRLANSVDVA